jgi:4-oxalocrotonate tautomerase
VPTVQITFAEGRTVEQKREMVRKVTEAISDSIKIAPEHVTVMIYDLPRHNCGKNGKLLSDL